MATIPRRVRSTQPTGTSEIEETAARWYTNYQLKKQIEIEQDGPKNSKEGGYRQWLLDKITTVGRVIDPKGHKAILFKQPIGGLYGLKAERKTTPDWQEFVAAGLLRSKGGDVEKDCTATQWQFRPEATATIVQCLDDAGLLEECVAEGYPTHFIDPDLVLRYHQLHKDVITKDDIDLMLPDKVTWSIHPLTEPLGDIPDVD